MSSGYDEDTLATLSPEERAAIEDNKPTAEELAALQAVADGADSDAGDQDADDAGDEDDEDDGEGDDAAAAAASAAAAAAAASAPATPAAATAAQAAPTEPAPVAKPAPAPAPHYQAELPEDFDAQVAALKAREDDAWKKFEAGELNRDQLQAELGASATERVKLDRMATKAEIAREMNVQNAEARWASEIVAMKASALESHGIDYANDGEKAADFDGFVRALAGNPANSDKTMQWFLAEAHKRVVSLHGVAPKTAPAAQTPAAAPADPKAAARATRKANPAALPATLAQVPGGDGPGDVGGEFAALDALNGTDLEDAIARLTPAQRERYSKGL